MAVGDGQDKYSKPDYTLFGGEGGRMQGGGGVRMGGGEDKYSKPNDTLPMTKTGEGSYEICRDNMHGRC